MKKSLRNRKSEKSVSLFWLFSAFRSFLVVVAMSLSSPTSKTHCDLCNRKFGYFDVWKVKCTSCELAICNECSSQNLCKVCVAETLDAVEHPRTPQQRSTKEEEEETTVQRTEKWSSRLELTTEKAAIDKRDVEQLIVSENQDVSQLWTSLNSALKELDKQAHALDGDMIDVYEVKRRRSSMLETVRKWRASSDMAKQLDREAEIAGVSPLKTMTRDELAEELSVKSSELNAAMELNRELSERLAAFLVEKTESDLLPSPSTDQSPSSLSPDLLGRLAAKDAAHEAHLRHVSKVHVEQFANLRREMEKDRRMLLRKIAKNVRKFKDTHTDIVTKQHTYLANLMDKLNRANEMLKSSGLPVVEDHESTEKTSSSCCGTREDRFDSIRLEHEIDTILDGRYDWKGDAAQKVRLIAKDILLELCRAPECISLVIRHGSIHSTASHLDEDDPHPPGLVVTSKPRHVSDRSSIISKEIEKYPPGIKSLFQSDKSTSDEQ